jgi:hypothetical protein
MTDLRGDFIIKTDEPSVTIEVVWDHEFNITGVDPTAHTRVVRDLEIQLENWRMCGVPRCILIHNGRKVGELLAAA